MKKYFVLVLTALTAAGLLSGCSSAAKNQSGAAPKGDKTQTESSGEKEKLVIGASSTPHAEILRAAKDIMAEKGFELEIVEYVDYVQPNMALRSGDLDGNYFQHELYLEQFNEENKADLKAAAYIHYEPFGIYAGRSSSLEELQKGAKIAVPNDATNEARALLLLEEQGLIKLKEGAGLKATKKDIEQNEKKLEIVEIEAAQLARSLQDVDLAIINGNYALQAGFKTEEALAVEDKESAGATVYSNIIAVRAEDEHKEGIKALAEALQSDTVKAFIEETYSGAVVPVF